MTHTSTRRRGYILVEMLVTLGLIAVAATLAGRLVFGSIDLGRQGREAEQATSVIDHAAAAVRRDSERATPVAVDKGVKLGAATWTADGDALVRAENGRDQSFGPLPGNASIDTDGGTVRLHIGTATWAFRPVVNGGTQ